MLVAQIDRELSTGVVHEGDRFSARLVTPVEGIPADLRIYGTVLEAHRGGGAEDPVLRLRLDRIGGCPLPARITSMEMEEGGTPPGEGFRGGAIVGAVLGGIMFRGPGMVSGFGVGMTGGSVDEARKRRTDAWVAQGALVQLRLTEPIDLRSCTTPQRERISTRSAHPM
jgi:hypothetical protein